MKNLAVALTAETWSGVADLLLPELGHRVQQHRVNWEPHALSFEFLFAENSAFLAQLMEVEWRSTPPQKLVCRNVRLQRGPYVLTLDEITLHRVNVSEWPDDWVLSEEASPKRLRLSTFAPSIRFGLSGPVRHSVHSIWRENWPPTMFLPSKMERPGRRAIRLNTLPPAIEVVIHSEDALEADCDQIRMALQLACGAPLPIKLKVTPGACEVFRKAASPESQLPMFRDGGLCRGPIHDMLGAVLQMPEPEFESLRFAAALTVEGKNPALPLEIRYLILMMCIEMLDGRRVLSDDSTAALLGVDMQVAKLLNGMRNQLIHAHHGGGYRNAFQAFLHQNGGTVPALPSSWAHTIDQQHSSLHFERLYLQLCERIDALWCRRLNVRDAQTSRYSVSGWSTLGELPPPFEPGHLHESMPGNERSNNAQHTKELETALKKKKEEIDVLKKRLNEKDRLIGEKCREIKVLQTALPCHTADSADGATAAVLASTQALPDGH